MWRKDGQELYYLSPDGMLVAASIMSSPSGLEISTRRALFEAPEVPPATSRKQYAVLDNGERFIFNAITEDVPRSIAVIRNWKSLVENP